MSLHFFNMLLTYLETIQMKMGTYFTTRKCITGPYVQVPTNLNIFKRVIRLDKICTRPMTQSKASLRKKTALF